jgi:cytidylate kinase
MNNTYVPVITLDGPSGTGKGTLCHKLAKHLNWNFLDSGSIYRVLAYKALQNNINLSNCDSLVILATNLDLKFDVGADQSVFVMLDNQDIAKQIRTEVIGQNASIIAAIPEVRQALLERQRVFAKPPGLVTDGRDMGTIVFPKAILKIYLYATEDERAMRRYLQLQESGNDATLEQVVDELKKRDARDMKRTHAPLAPSEEAVLLDTTGLSIAQVFANILQLVHERLDLVKNLL